ncbi:hypothetical protein AC626_09420 [Pseudoalteromonas rubra]|uniref:Response regulator n=2 Tax=Pseudoalteromonas TaxID=53246 RepID=A0A0L0ETA2_9GAMM|nr:hypothetical protein AC626_09420 [Pseudoalteromonas rubra]
MLSSLNLQVSIAENGQVAVEMIKAQAFDIVLMDIQMPVMDGYSATKYIRKLSQFNALPIIAMTANVMKEDLQKCQSAGMNGHIGKPINFNQMAETIRNHLYKQSEPTDPVALQTEAQLDKGKEVKNDEQIEIAGVDVERAIKRLGGNDKAFWSIIKKFARNQIEETINLNQALVIGDLEHAERIAHSLKGASANLCMDDLSKRAAEIEKAIGSGEQVELEQVEDLTEFLRKLHKQLSELNQEDTPLIKRTNVVSLKVTKEDFIQLEALLLSCDTQSVEQVRELAANHKLDETTSERLIDLIEDFEFEEAAKVVAHLLEKSA